MSKHYIKPGVCGICGRAVVRFHDKPERGWINGHYYTQNAKKEFILEMVRCMYCKEKGHSREFDEFGKLHPNGIPKSSTCDY